MEDKVKNMFDRLLKRKESYKEFKKTIMQDLRVARKLGFNTECEKLIVDKQWVDDILESIEEDLIEMQSL
jgi:hypothetical protein